MKKSLRDLYPLRYDIPLILLASLVMLLVGLNTPVLTVQKMWEQNTFSIMSGIKNLYREKHYFLSFVVFFFSMVFPFVKLASLTAIWFVRLTDALRKWVLNLLLALGKWSMLDVFVVAVIVVTVKLGVLAKAQPEQGIYYFGYSILLSMIAATLMNVLAKRNRVSTG